ncbi:MAG TPA: hypothetical protein VE196_04960, partial [Pseudonocardiaceae bacterium]|nr:hypothetical protein [Pseudonocardiaceae bacterium]
MFRSQPIRVILVREPRRPGLALVTTDMHTGARACHHPDRRPACLPGSPSWPASGRTLHAWHQELCAHFDHPDVSNGPT